MGDTIDRQAAIDILEVAINDDWEFDYAKDRIIELHVQSEIIRCKDCKFFIDHRCRYWRTLDDWRGTDDFCSKAERKVNEELDI